MRSLLFIILIIPFIAFAGCPLCDQLREYHRTHPENNYEYYEDYLIEQAWLFAYEQQRAPNANF